LAENKLLQTGSWWDQDLGSDPIATLKKKLGREEGWEYGDILPGRIKDGQREWAVPNLLRDPVMDMLDLIGGTKTGQIPKNALFSLLDLGYPANALLGPRGAVGIFGGKLAAQADRRAMNQATDDLGQGLKHPDQIWQETGWGNKFPDQQMRFEIDDAAAKFKPDMPELKFFAGFDEVPKLGQLLDHPDLFKHYPELTDIPVYSTGMNFGIRGGVGFTQAGKPFMQLDPIMLQKEPEIALKTILHEVQHLVQKKEDFADGGNVAQFLPENFSAIKTETSNQMFKLEEDARKAYAEIAHRNGIMNDPVSFRYDLLSGRAPEFRTRNWDKLSPEQTEKIYQDLAQVPEVKAYFNKIFEMHDLGKLEGEALLKYKRLAGEVESRLVEDRSNLPETVRRAYPPWKQFDVPASEQSVVQRGGGGGEGNREIAEEAQKLPFNVRLREKLFETEDNFFRKNPQITGMAAEDNSVVLNPYSKLSAIEKQAVVFNEAARIFMRTSKNKPNFILTSEQKKQFQGTAYENNEQAMKETIAARIFSGDPSAKESTPEQRAFVEKLRAINPVSGPKK
jgi:hypothetical protein